MKKISFNEVMNNLPPGRRGYLRPALRQSMEKSGRVCVIVDDDPTGNQTVYGIPLLTHWSLDSLESEIRSGSRVFYLLTNSRSLSEERAAEIGQEIGERLRDLSNRLNIPLSLISRSDSTLRGHFPAEVDALAEGAGRADAIRVLVPALFEGGRITAGDIHYVREGEELIPVAGTPFARDSSFGYRSSDLKEWVEEKTGGRIGAASVLSVTLENIREGGPDRVGERILSTPPGGVCIVNVIDYTDLDTVCLACHRAEKDGASLIYRTSSSFVPSYIGLEPRDLLDPGEIGSGSCGGLIIVGSHVPRSTLQLNYLFNHLELFSMELEVPLLADPGKSDGYVQSVVERIRPRLLDRQDVVLYTGRQVVSEGDPAADLALGRRITASVTGIVRRLDLCPRYLLAKGGITAHELAVTGLGMKRSVGRGQLIPGVPVWKMGEETRFPGMDYVVFPGNVGGEEALYRMVASLTKQ